MKVVAKIEERQITAMDLHVLHLRHHVEIVELTGVESTLHAGDDFLFCLSPGSSKETVVNIPTQRTPCHQTLQPASTRREALPCLDEIERAQRVCQIARGVEQRVQDVTVVAAE